jgi:hypothetical protein
MIISHKYKFIFIKPTKVAGTSIEIALAPLCSPEDIITPITTYDPRIDSTAYEHPARNYKEKGYYNHITPAKIKKLAGDEIWERYFKFSVVRDPWDQMISRYYSFLHKKEEKGETFLQRTRKRYWKAFSLHDQDSLDFALFLSSFNKYLTNERFYFDPKGQPWCDGYIRYESLARDFNEVCRKLGIPETELPVTKNRLRNHSQPVGTYFKNHNINRIRKLYRRTFEFFDYPSSPF